LFVELSKIQAKWGKDYTDALDKILVEINEALPVGTRKITQSKLKSPHRRRPGSSGLP
jgi:hypothetical protein